MNDPLRLVAPKFERFANSLVVDVGRVVAVVTEDDRAGQGTVLLDDGTQLHCTQWAAAELSKRLLPPNVTEVKTDASAQVSISEVGTTAP